jgi:transposase-like protein
MANIHRTSEQWQQIFEQHASSGLQIAAFCKQQKLNTSSFYAWRKRLENNTLCTTVTDKQGISENNQDDWVNVTQEQAMPSPNWDVELALPNGIVLRMMNR